MKQTSIEWLFDQIPLEWTIKRSAFEVLQQAKEMHKQEIIDAAERWKGTDFAERYYEETFGSKGSDFKQFSLYEHKDTITSADTQVSKTFLESVPQQETIYTEEQVREAIESFRKIRIIYDYEIEEIIQSLKQPKQ